MNTIKLLSQVAQQYVPSKEVYPMGFDYFDHAMDGGLRDGELVTVSASTGEGKSTFMRNVSVNFSKKSIPSLWFSYEENPYYLYENFKKLTITPEDLLIYSPIELISGDLKFIEQEIKEGVEEKGIKVVIIDHLHYIIDLKSALNSSLMIGGMVRELKGMAVRNKIIIFLIAHTRKINVGDELNLSSIRDSGLVVCESDYVFLIERKRHKKTAREKLASDFISSGDEYFDQGRVTLAKNRRTGKILYMDFSVKDGRFLPITNIYGTEPNPDIEYPN